MGLTEQQKSERRTGIGSSDIPAILGKSPFANAFDVWLSKVEGMDNEGSFASELGDLMEDTVLTIYDRKAKPQELFRRPGTLRHPTKPWVVDSPDAMAVFPDWAVRPVEAKTSRFSGDWGAEGTDEIPENYVLQATWHLIVARENNHSVSACDVPVLIRTDEFRIYRVRWDAELAGVMLQEGERFWRDHVETKKPPKMDGSRSVDGWLKKRFPKDSGAVLEATEEDERLAVSLLVAEEQSKVAEVKVKSLISQIQLRMEDATELRGSFGKLTWKKNKPSHVTDWEGIAKSLMKNLPESLCQNLMVEHCTKKEGNRPFLKKWS